MDSEIQEFLRRKEKREEKEKLLLSQGFGIKITRDQTSTRTPLECDLYIEISKNIRNPERIVSIYNYAKENYKHGSEIYYKKVDENEYIVKIISGKYRCSWCENFRRDLEKKYNTPVMNRGQCLAYSRSEG